jgi:hypothetical protein
MTSADRGEEVMALKQFTLTFSHAVGDRSEIDDLFIDHEVTLSILKDRLSSDGGWVEISLEGEIDEIQRAMANVTPVHLRPMQLADANPMP